jgi:hypothetical protein
MIIAALGFPDPDLRNLGLLTGRIFFLKHPH